MISMIDFVLVVLLVCGGGTVGVTGLLRTSLIGKSCPSPLVNAWKVKIGERYFVITPAHVLTYGRKTEDGNKWTFSGFMDDFQSLNWYVSKEYILEPRIKFDIAWAEVNAGQYGDALPLFRSATTDSLEAEVFYRPRFNAEGQRKNSSSQLHMMKAVLNPTGDDNLLEDSQHSFEVQNTGYRGMSGAAALSPEGELIGLLARVGKKVPMKKREDDPATRALLQRLKSSTKAVPQTVSPTATTSSSVVSATVAAQRKPNFFQAAVRSFLGLDELQEQFSGINERLSIIEEEMSGIKDEMSGIKDEMSGIKEGQIYVIENTLRLTDVAEIATVANAHRSFFIPAAVIARICDPISPLEALRFFGEKGVCDTHTPASLVDYTS